MPYLLPPATQFENNLQETIGSKALVSWKTRASSTNAELMQKLKKTPSNTPYILGAHYQSAGKGRGGKAFIAKTGQSLLFSLGICTNISFKILPLLPIAFGIASCKALRTFANENTANDLKLKWPNDIMWHDAKLSGILTECSFIRYSENNMPYVAVVIGQGINLVGADQLSKDHQRDIADLSTIGLHIAPNEIIHCIVSYWLDILQQLEAQQGAIWLKDFNQMNYLNNQLVDVFEHDQWILSGKAIGLDEFGRLMIESSLGLSHISVGDVSIRKRMIYG